MKIATTIPQTDAGAAPIGANDDVPGSQAGTRRKWHRLWQWPLRLAGLAALLAVAMPVVALVLLLGREVSAPSWLRLLIEERATAVLEGGDLRFGTITLSLGQDLHPRVTMPDAVLRDATGRVLARVPEIGILLSPRGVLFRREVLVQEIRLTGAQIDLARDAAGRVALAFGGATDTDRPPAPQQQAAGLIGLLEEFDRLFDRPALAALEQVRIDGLIVNYLDARAGRGWTVDGGLVSLDLRDAVTRLSADVSLLSGRSFVTRVRLNYESPRDSPAARLSATVVDAAARDIASQSPALSWLSVVDAPISAAFRGEIDAEGNPGAFSVALKIAGGALAPTTGAQPVPFEQARAYLSYDAPTGTLVFDQVDLRSDWGALRAEGQAYLREMTDGWPAALLGQFTLTAISLNPGDIYPEPLRLPAAYMDFRLRLDPFRLTLGNVSVTDEAGHGTGRIAMGGEIAAYPEGWNLALDLGVEEVTTARVLQVWPVDFRPGTRAWFAQNVSTGTLTNIAGGLRVQPGQPPVVGMSQEFRDVTVQPLRQQAPITGAIGHASLVDHRLSLVLSKGQMVPPDGGAVDVAGSWMTIPDTRIRNPPAIIGLRTDSTITAALSALDQPPFGFLTRAGLPVTLADGRASVVAEIRLPLAPVIPPGVLDWNATATLHDLRSETLVPDRVLAASAVTMTADPGELSITGPVRLGQVPATGTWRQALGPDADGASVVEAEVELSERFITEFGIGLPPGSVTGAGQGQVRIDLAPGAAPRFAMTSTLTGLRLSLPPLGWSKPAGTAGSFSVAGTLGATPRIDRIALDAAGLRATGDITLNAAGLDRARFSRLRLGDWFDAPVTLVGRGAGRPPGVRIDGGSLDLRRASFGDGGDGGGPMDVRLDRLQVTEGIALTGFRGEFDTSAGLAGPFSANVNGGAAVTGQVAPQRGRTAVQLLAADAGAVIRDAGLIRNGDGGAMDLRLVPAAGEGQFDGSLSITDLRVRDAPALASILNAVSVVGLLQQMAGQGLVFDDVRADFRLTPDRIIVTQSSAVGAGLGISLDGTYMTSTNEMDFQGVVSPFYLINAVGSVLKRRGEGLIGFNYDLRGQPSDPRVLVNPLSVLTPGMFREIFRRPAPVLAD